MSVKACLPKHIKDPYKEKLREAIRNRVASYLTNARHASLGLMYMAKEMYRDVMEIKIFELPDEFSDKTFIRHLMLGTEETSRRNERVHALHEKDPFYIFHGTRYRITVMFTKSGRRNTSRT